MHIFALETDIEKLKKRFLSSEEREIRTVSYHGFRFLASLFRDVILTIVIIASVIGLSFTDVPKLWIIPTAIVLWIFLVFRSLLRSYIDWKYDFILITTDKVIMVDQSSIFRQKITPMNLENFASASAETQFMNLFSFGILHFSLKEGVGEEVKLRYIPNAQDTAACLSDTITTFQRRKDLRRHGGSFEHDHQ